MCYQTLLTLLLASTKVNKPDELVNDLLPSSEKSVEMTIDKLKTNQF